MTARRLIMPAILIVDDEYFIAQGIRSNVDWNALGITQVYTAYSADQARKVFETSPVDILLSDVEMPRESGLDLIRWVRDNGYESINVLLTGHANFSYAQDAIGLQVFRYVLKPADTGELTQTLKDALQKVADSKASEEAAAKLRIQTFFRELFRGAIEADQDAIAEYLNAHDIPDDALSECYHYCYLSAAPLISAGSSAGIAEGLPFGRISGLFAHCFQDADHSAIVDLNDFGFMLCLDPAVAADTGAANASFTQFVQALSAEFPAFRFVLYTFSDAPLYSAAYAYELLKRYSMQILSETSTVIPVLTQSVPGSDSGVVFENDLLRKWGEWLVQGRPDDVMLELRHKLGTSSVYSSRYLMMSYYQLVHMVFALFSERMIPIDEALSLSDVPSSPAQITSSADNFLHWADRTFHAFSTLIQQKSAPDSTVSTVRKYIGSHLADPDLDRNSIAAAVHMSPDYLSYLYHKETGGVLSSYINEERIALARKLLSTTDQPLSVVASSCGFANDTYFHKQFKKLTGQTPNAYRSAFRKG